MNDQRNLSHFQGKEPFLEQILRQIRFLAVRPLIKNGTTVLDLGCGYDAEFLRTISPKIKLGIGFDISVKKKEIAKNIKLFSKKINSKLKLPKNYFDTITSLAVFEHLGKTQEVVNFSFNALRKGGTLAITTPNPKGKFLLEFLAFKLRLISQTEINDHKHYYSKNEIRKLFINAGFKKQNIKISYFWFWCNILATAKK